MANEKQQLSEMLNQPDQSRGLFDAVKDTVQAIAPGLSLNKMLSDVGAELWTGSMCRAEWNWPRLYSMAVRSCPMGLGRTRRRRSRAPASTACPSRQ